MTLPIFNWKLGARLTTAMTLTVALIGAYAAGDERLIEQGRQALAPVSTKEMFYSLGKFSQSFNKRNLTNQQILLINEKLASYTGSSEMMAAVQNVGRAILIERNDHDVVDAMNTYGPALLGSSSDQLRQLMLILVEITGSVLCHL